MSHTINPYGINLSTDSETEGFDLQAGQTWIYPTNYPIRTYQYNIIEQALYKNTLVSLPTGLGKTFIAAVVMYNFFRWYPTGKVIFMAPTKPLVKQQIEACYNIMAIPKDVTVELTGSKISSLRGDVWNEKRVFFITPQILQNDLDKLDFHKKIKCLVFDEAHRAKGNHAYCEVIRKLNNQNKYFRVLALSATPGNSIADVLEVVQNLLIGHLEFRTEESLDVYPYVFERKLTTIVVPLGEKLQQIRDDYLQVLEYYTRTLVKYKVIQGNCGNLTKGKIFMILKEFQKKPSGSTPNYGEITKSLNICITLYHGFELLIRHGLRSFLSFFQEHVDKPLLRGNVRLVEIMNDIREYLGPDLVVEQLPDGSLAEIPENAKYGHPKFYKLRDILLSHFKREDDPSNSRVIVFFEYRNSVMEAYALLSQERPLLKPRIFLGQSRGITQRQQINVVKSFKEGQCNILLSTCIGEEGLDIGEVDLIVCFDISNKSPIRMIQRMGRTGRKKEGHITILVTEGKEQQILKDCLMHKNNLASHVLSSKELAKGLFVNTCRLVPAGIVPKCDKIYITVKKAGVSKKNSLKDMFNKISNNSSEPCFSPDLEIIDVQYKIPEVTNLWNTGNPLDKNVLISPLLSKHIEKQRNLQSTTFIKHSPNTKLLVDLLQYVDSRRYNIPVTQLGIPQLTQSRNLKQGDIRDMFRKTQCSNEPLGDDSTTSLQIVQDHFSLFSKELLYEISNYLSLQLTYPEHCKHCPNINSSCSNFEVSYTKIPIWRQCDESILNTLTAENLNLFSDLHLRDTTDCEKNNKQENKQFNYLTKVNSNYDLLKQQYQDILVFFKLTSLEYLFFSTEDRNIAMDAVAESDEILKKNNEVHEISDNETSPVLCTSRKSRSIRHVTRVLANESHDNVNSVPSNNSSNIAIEDRDIFNNFQLNDITEHKTSPVLSRKVNDFKYQLASPNNESSPRVKPNLKKLKLSHYSDSHVKIDSPLKFIENTFQSSSTPFSHKEKRRKEKEFLYSESKNTKDNNCKTNNSNESAINMSYCNESITQIIRTVNTTQAANKHKNISSTVLNDSDLFIDDVCDLKVFGIDCDVNKSTVVPNREAGETTVSSKYFKEENSSIVHNEQERDSSFKILKRRKKGTNQFIEEEAELSGSDSVDNSEDDEEDQNFYDESFINDNTENVDTQMQALYLQSTRSPKNRGMFKIPKRPKYVSNIYSQDVPEEDSVIDDSFVVHDDFEEVHCELSELEILEQKLQQKKKRKNEIKRRRIQQLSSDDSD